MAKANGFSCNLIALDIRYNKATFDFNSITGIKGITFNVKVPLMK